VTHPATAPHAVRFGIHSGQQYASFEECLTLWHTAEELGYDWVSCFDHLRPPLGGPGGPCLEATSLLAALAARTSRVRCGLLVSPVTWRHPALAAAAAATIDQVSGGRLEFGVGAGGADLGYAQYGIPFPPAGTRLDMLDEACRVMRGLWEHESTTFTGAHFQFVDARLEPKPVQRRLPLVIGGGGERRMLRLVAEHADVWNTLARSPTTFRRKAEALARHCTDLGRDPAEIRWSVTFRAVLADTPREAERRRAAAGRLAGRGGVPDVRHSGGLRAGPAAVCAAGRTGLPARRASTDGLADRTAVRGARDPGAPGRTGPVTCAVQVARTCAS
jgi:alkanesulfonate monooxygenase SsuD/methylene tetrahydromethanopterin reductase-like flavin-dependent oxidoreductase (luciferase family)